MTDTPGQNPWNSLEIVKLGFSALTPIALAILGFYIQRVTKRLENRQWTNQKLIEKRLVIYDQIAPLMNDLLCYFTYVGCWKEMDPPAVVKMKRELDKRVYLAAPLFPEAFVSAYDAFAKACFSAYGQWGTDATLRTAPQNREKYHSTAWQPEWAKCFSQDVTDPKEIQRVYQEVMLQFTASFGELSFKSSFPFRLGHMFGSRLE
jgi:hypothetical protein